MPHHRYWWQTGNRRHSYRFDSEHGLENRACFALLPFFGVHARALQSRSSADQPAVDAPVNEQGELCIAQSWPGMMRGVFGEPERFFNTYFVQQPGFYFSGDGAIKDEDGYFRLMGRIDDVVNVSGHRMGTPEVEAALNSYTTSVAESAVVGFPTTSKARGPLRIRYSENRRSGIRCP